MVVQKVIIRFFRNYCIYRKMAENLSDLHNARQNLVGDVVFLELPTFKSYFVNKVKIFNLLERGQGVLEFSSPWIGGVNL